MVVRARFGALALLFLLLSFASDARGAQLPAVRRAASTEGKRALATRLLRRADGHKKRSLRDVLDEHAPRVKPHVVRDEERARERDAQAREQTEREAEAGEHNGFVLGSVSQLFAWAIQHTAAARGENASATISLSTTGERVLTQPLRVEEEAAPLAARALPHLSAVTAVEDEIRLNEMRGETEAQSEVHAEAQFREYSELHVLRESIRVLNDGAHAAVSRLVASLLQLEELCHSIDNGRDLHLSGGVQPLVRTLSAPQHVVRANAAWALATCCQNNPTVQNASLQLGAVPTLVRMAASDDVAVVRARALFALNAILELEEARVEFERLPSSIHALRRSLRELEDVRATRRALNLAELLLTKNLDAWKTMLEAWDLPVLVERLMRQHRNSDVRESAARTIAALDGGHVA